MQKFFVEEEQINLENNRVIILGKDINHIKNVLRYKEGQKIEITNKKTEKSYICQISNIQENEIECNIIEKNETNKEANVYIHILQGIPKADKMELIIQKCTELGVKEITPVNMKRCVVKISEKDENKKIIRWQNIAEVAAKQCGREHIPKINSIHNLENIFKLLKNYDILIIAYEKEKNRSLKQEIEKLKEKVNEDIKIAVLIGPEGGIDELEIEKLKDAKIVTLGNRILRTETVAFVICSILMYELRRFGRVQMKREILKQTKVEKEME